MHDALAGRQAVDRPLTSGGTGSAGRRCTGTRRCLPRHILEAAAIGAAARQMVGVEQEPAVRLAGAGNELALRRKAIERRVLRVELDRRRRPNSAAMSPAVRRCTIASRIGVLFCPGALISMSQPSATASSHEWRNAANRRRLSSPSRTASRTRRPGLPPSCRRGGSGPAPAHGSCRPPRSARSRSAAARPHRSRPARAASSAVASGVVSRVQVCSARRPKACVMCASCAGRPCGTPTG